MVALPPRPLGRGTRASVSDGVKAECVRVTAARKKKKCTTEKTYIAAGVKSEKDMTFKWDVLLAISGRPVRAAAVDAMCTSATSRYVRAMMVLCVFFSVVRKDFFFFFRVST